MNTTADKLLALTGAKSIRAIAAQAGLDTSTTNRQANGTSSLTIETVVSICRAYSLDFATTFVAVGFITQDEADKLGRMHSLSEYTDLELAQEIVDRIEAGTVTEVLSEPLNIDPRPSNVIDGGFGQTATPDDLRRVASEDDGDNGEENHD